MRQICVYAQPTARIRRLIAAMSQKLVPRAKKNARPRTYSRLVPQSPNNKPAACFHPTLRGRSDANKARAAGFARPAGTAVCMVVLRRARDFSRNANARSRAPDPAGGGKQRSSHSVCSELGDLISGRRQESEDVVPFQEPTGLADGLGLESAPGSSWIPAPPVRPFSAGSHPWVPRTTPLVLSPFEGPIPCVVSAVTYRRKR